MTVNKINREEFVAWATETTVDYASETVPGKVKGTRKRLRFMCKLGGGYQVVLGPSDILYDGDDFDAAAEAYRRAGS